MHLIYLDESGNTGLAFNDPQQPIFALGALVVPESQWLTLETELQASTDQFFPSPRPEDFEVHGSELINSRGFFRQFPIQARLDFFRTWLEIAARHKLRFIYRAIEKKRFARWLNDTFGPGILINPHVAAFALISQVVHEHLRALPGSPLGIFISDENHEVAPDVEKSIRVLRGDGGGRLRLSQIVEKGFFIASHYSLPLQLCDLCIYAARRKEEEKAGLNVKPIDRHCIPWIEPLIHRGNESMVDVLAWLQAQQKNERPGA